MYYLLKNKPNTLFYLNKPACTKGFVGSPLISAGLPPCLLNPIKIAGVEYIFPTTFSIFGLLVYEPSRPLRSSEAAFSFYASIIWNKLPENYKSAEILRYFESRLKTIFFRAAF